MKLNAKPNTLLSCKSRNTNLNLAKSVSSTALQARIANEKTKGQHTKAVLRIYECRPSYDSFVVGSSAVLRLNFCANYPPLRKVQKR